MTRLAFTIAALPQEIRVGVIGIGSIGKGMVYQAGNSSAQAMDCVPSPMFAWTAQRLGQPAWGASTAVVESLADMHTAIRAGRLAVCGTAPLIAQSELVDVLVDCSNSVAGGLQFAGSAIAHHKHVVMMNSRPT